MGVRICKTNRTFTKSRVVAFYNHGLFLSYEGKNHRQRKFLSLWLICALFVCPQYIASGFIVNRFDGSGPELIGRDS